MTGPRLTMPELFRPAPQAGPELYKTYDVTPYTRRATCAEVNCPRQRNGWRSVLDVSTAAGSKSANWIRLKSGRSFAYTQTGTVVTFAFAAGQTCLGVHKVAQSRAPLLRVLGGDWRGNPRNVPTREMRPADWVDDFASHQATLSEAHKRG